MKTFNSKKLSKVKIDTLANGNEIYIAFDKYELKKISEDISIDGADFVREITLWVYDLKPKTTLFAKKAVYEVVNYTKMVSVSVSSQEKIDELLQTLILVKNGLDFTNTSYYKQISKNNRKKILDYVQASNTKGYVDNLLLEVDM